jgi:hypothetical protein
VDWFEKLTGFREVDYAATRAKFEVDGDRLKSVVNGKSYGAGRLELVSLSTLRDQVTSHRPSGRLNVSLVSGDVREMHSCAEYAGALFQVASQFNLLEMVGPDKTPEDGVTIYQHDRTQGPACAMAAGAAAIYRNYFAAVDGQSGQTRERQLDALANLGVTLSELLKIHVHKLWTMKNGYALGSESGLKAIADLLARSTSHDIDRLRGRLRIGLHQDVEVTDAAQPFSIGPHLPRSFWKPLMKQRSGRPY